MENVWLCELMRYCMTFSKLQVFKTFKSIARSTNSLPTILSLDNTKVTLLCVPCLMFITVSMATQQSLVQKLRDLW